MISSESNVSLPYDERDDCFRDVGIVHHTPAPSTPSLNSGRTRRRSRVPSNSLHHHPSDLPVHHGPYSDDIRGVRHRPFSGGKRIHGRTNASFKEQPPPSIGAIASATGRLISLYCVHIRHALRKPCRILRRSLRRSCLTLLASIVILALFLVRGFYIDVVRICAPSQEASLQSLKQQRPFVEYYVHGRGNGHYARSRAIVGELNEAGVDVRMFLDRATMLKAYYEEAAHEEVPSESEKGRGTTTAIAVTSVTPEFGPFSSLSHTIERITGDCEASFQKSKYPLLVIADGDFPGMLRAKLGGIPSVGISHGQVFNIVPTPTWLPRHKHRAWKNQKRLNGFAALFSNWQIATNFLHMETSLSSGVVARPPLRQAVKKMAQARHGGPKPPVLEETNLFGEATNTTNPEPAKNRRRLVLCYFRDGNGEVVTQALLRAGFDVLNFSTGYDKDHTGKQDKKFGSKWIIHNDKKRPPKLMAKSEKGHQKRRLTSLHDDDSLAPPLMIRITDRSLFVPLMSIVDGVASSAGSQLMSECIYMGMPLLALYKEKDDEQMLNVEMTRHFDPKKQTHVFGSSFESFRAATAGSNYHLRGYSNNHTDMPAIVDTPITDTAMTKAAFRAFGGFVNTVYLSKVSQSYFESLATPNTNTTQVGNETANAATEQEVFEDAFHGMPDAAAIILEIIKQVQNKEGNA